MNKCVDCAYFLNCKDANEEKVCKKYRYIRKNIEIKEEITNMIKEKSIEMQIADLFYKMCPNVPPQLLASTVMQTIENFKELDNLYSGKEYKIVPTINDNLVETKKENKKGLLYDGPINLGLTIEEIDKIVEKSKKEWGRKIKMEKMESIDYQSKYEEEKKKREKIEKDYISLKEQTNKVNAKVKELESKSINNVEIYEKVCKENEELKRQILQVIQEKETYKKGIDKLILTLGK